MSLLLLTAASAVDYRNGANWLCRPGRHDVCAAELATTLVTPDGRMRPARVPRSGPRDVDCFYVYPTVSLDPSGNSDLVAGREERDMTEARLAPFRGVCRTFAPIYRQVTLTALRQALGGAPIKGDFALAYADVLAAWRNYLTHDNAGRPFVLIGHSQGSAMLKRLVAEEIDGKPIQQRLLSAILPGTSVAVPRGELVGGDFKSVPLCRASGQTQCVVTWASYRSTLGPPSNALFGRVTTAGMEAGCTNPARLAGGAAPLGATFGSPWWRGGVAQYARPSVGWSLNGRAVPTRYVSMPGFLAGECVRRGGVEYLAIGVGPTKAEPLANTVVGVPTIGDDAYPDWGFHVVDAELVQGDLIRLVARQRAAYLTTTRGR